MKRKSYIILVIICLITLSSQIVFANEYLSEESTNKITLTANEEQLKIINNLENFEDLTPLEVIKIVFPEEYKKINFKDTKLLNKKFDYEKAFNFDSLTYVSDINISGNDIVYESYNNYDTTESYVESSLKNNLGERVAYTLNYGTDITYLEAKGAANPETGTYRTYGKHAWMAIDTYGNDIEVYNVSSTTYISYVNPYN
jgi:hypothetical protein